ncbi:MAG: endonuclease [Bacteroidota bacterium]
MKRILCLLLLIPVIGFTQIPPGYYNSANGLNGEPLRIALYNIIKGHTVLSYTPGLWNAYYSTDKRTDGKVWDIYADIPGGTPAYEYTFGANQCGNGLNHENSCYNREHTWPQSKFNSLSPMYSDLFIVYPTDYYVNGQRADFPYGKAGTPVLKTFTNGSKLGPNTYLGAPATTCFEPIDSFKGDIARNYFYITTRYWADSSSFNDWEMATKVTLKSWTIQMLLEWHHLDPVSQKEIDRNDSVYALQHNRNPFIDYPLYADCIWGTGDCTTSVTNISANRESTIIYPNPTKDIVNIHSLQAIQLIDIMDMQGRVMIHNALETATKNTSLSVVQLPSANYIIKVQDQTGVTTQKLLIQ